MTSSTFKEAQERLLARRAAREVTLAAEPPADVAAQLPFPLNRAATRLSPFWSAIQGREGTRPSYRVGQVDAELLDEELLQLLKGQIGDALKYYGAHLQDDWAEEILLTLRLALFKLSIWDNDASYGASLQNLKYSDARVSGIFPAKPTKVQKTLYGFLTTIGRYGWDRWETWLVDQEGGYSAPSLAVQRLSTFTTWASTTHSIASFASFLVFLVNGRYRTLTDRLLRLRLVASSNQVSREISFEYLNRQLVWHAFTEFLLFVLPLVGIGRWRRWLSKAWKRTTTALSAEEKDGEPVKTGSLAFLPEQTCAICYQNHNPTSEAELLGANTLGSATTDIVNPYQTIPCGCIYCYVCLATKLEAEEGDGWSCLRCGELVHRCRPWLGDVLPKKAAKSSVKTVDFAESGQWSSIEPLDIG